MKLLCKLSSVIVLVSLLLLLPSSFASADEIVTFPDTCLEAAIRGEIGKPYGDIYQSDLDGLTRLDVINPPWEECRIYDLTGLEHCNNLTRLCLEGHSISDLSPLAGLTNITQLHLNSCGITDISQLAGLTNLTFLSLIHNLISDICPLLNLTQLSELYLDRNPLSDLSVNTCIPQLKAVVGTLTYSVTQPPNQPMNVSPVDGTSNVALPVTFVVSPFSDTDPGVPNIPEPGGIPDATQFQISTISGNYSSPILDITFDHYMATFTTGGGAPLNYSTIYYWRVRYQDIDYLWSPWSEETSFTTADGLEVVEIPDPNLEAAIREAIGQPTGDIYNSSLASLNQLFADGRGIVNLTGLEHCTGMSLLVLDQNSIADITPVASLAALQRVFLDSNNISDITPLSGITHLLDISLRSNKVSDIAPLQNLSRLRWLRLQNNQVSDIQPLIVCPGLQPNDNASEYVDLQKNPLSFASITVYIPQLLANRVNVRFDRTVTATGTGTVILEPGLGTVGNLTAVSESELPTEGKPYLEFPHGFFDFVVEELTPGASITLSITLPLPVPVGTQYWKYGPTPSNHTAHWYQIPMASDDGDNVVTITLVDGGLGDDDLVENAIIVDSGGPGFGGGCFIATAAYGTPMAEEIKILREFRDVYLLTNPAGQAFVDFYYKVSPPIAEFITEHPSLQPMVRAGLVPAVAMSTVIVNTTMAENMAIVVLLVFVSVAVAIWVIRRRGRSPEYT